MSAASDSRTVEAAQGNAQDETRLQALAALHVLDTPREERFDRIVRLAQRMFDVPTVVARRGLLPRHVPLDRVLRPFQTAEAAADGW